MAEVVGGEDGLRRSGRKRKATAKVLEMQIKEESRTFPTTRIPSARKKAPKRSKAPHTGDAIPPKSKTAAQRFSSRYPIHEPRKFGNAIVDKSSLTSKRPYGDKGPSRALTRSTTNSASAPFSSEFESHIFRAVTRTLSQKDLTVLQPAPVLQSRLQKANGAPNQQISTQVSSLAVRGGQPAPAYPATNLYPQIPPLAASKSGRGSIKAEPSSPARKSRALISDKNEHPVKREERARDAARSKEEDLLDIETLELRWKRAKVEADKAALDLAEAKLGIRGKRLRGG